MTPRNFRMRVTVRDTSDRVMPVIMEVEEYDRGELIAYAQRLIRNRVALSATPLDNEGGTNGTR